VAGDPYVLTVSVPAGYQPASARVDWSDVDIVAGEGTAAIRIEPDTTKTVDWSMRFSK